MTKLVKNSDILNTSMQLINIRDWAQATLKDTELDDFIEAEKRNTELMLTYQNAGLISYKWIEAKGWSELLNEEITLLFGHEITLAPGVTLLDIPIDPEWGMWEARYASDSNIDYNPVYQE